MKLTFCLQINTNIFHKLIVSLWVWMARHAQSTQSNNFIISWQYLKENVKGAVEFFMLIIVRPFFKVILPFFMCVTRHAQISENKKLAISQQYLKKEGNEEVDFLLAGKNENLLQIDSMILMGMVKHYQNSKFTTFVQYLKKKLKMKLIFYMQINIKVAIKVDFNTLGTKFGYKVILWLLLIMMKHTQITQSNNFANLCNISKKLGMDLFFTCR